MRLFLHGGAGGRKEPNELDKRFALSINSTKPLLFIPIANDIAVRPYENCLRWFYRIMNPLGITNIIMWVEDDLRKKTVADFNQFSGIYISGGNTFKLLKELKEFGTLEILKKMAERDVPIAGGSAGTIIFAQTIIPAIHGDKNLVGLKDFSALNLLHDYNTWCHYTDANIPTVQQYMKKYNLKKIVAIPDNSGILVTNTSIYRIGTTPVLIFEGDIIREMKSEEIYE